MGDPAVDDDFTVILHYAPTSSNPYVLTATLRGHLLSVREPQQRFVVRGSKGTFSKFGFDVQERQMQVDGRDAVTKPDFGVEPEDLWATLEIVGEDGKEVTSQRIESLKGDYQELYRNLANVIRYDEEPEVKWQDAELTMLITELALKSSREGRTIEVSRVEEQSLLNDNGREGNEIDVKFCSSRLGLGSMSTSASPSPRPSLGSTPSHSSSNSTPSRSVSSTPPSSETPSSASSTFESPCAASASASTARASLFRRTSSGHWLGSLFARR
ncbi:hypothetical protein FRC18_005083 [Serendipita sp. 400]|nr:hypothetical protein FRC18_005083 [Serendipita sp. 400]